MKILVINGPNLQLLGKRKPEIYGTLTLEEIEKRVTLIADELKTKVEFFQSNHEGCIVDKIGNAPMNGIKGIIINPGAYTHTSIAIHDAIEAVGLPSIEVHISNIYKREEFRKHSYIAPACLGQISGLGVIGYELAIKALTQIITLCPEKN